MKRNNNMMTSLLCKKLLVLSFVAMTHFASAQLLVPFSSDPKLYQSIPIIHLVKDSLLATIDHDIHSTENIAGFVFHVDYSSDNAGEWKAISSDYKTWLLKLKIADAQGLAFVFSQVKLDRGVKLFIQNENKINGPFDLDDIPVTGRLSMGYFPGDEIVIELDVPANSQSTHLTLSAVSFTDNPLLINSSARPGRAKQSESCYTCLTGRFWDEPKSAVVKIITFRESLALMCTGALINNTMQDARPYVITAQHCIADQTDADNSIFIFGDFDLNCGAASISQQSGFNGSILRASSYENDFSLVELYEQVPLGARPYFAGWDISDSHLNQLSCIHHPLGGSKKISIAHDRAAVSDFFEEGKPARAPESFWHVRQWDAGFTEAGSSGAPLFNEDKNIIGTLTGGKSTCAYPFHDYFERLSASWNQSEDAAKQLRYWLDPLSSGKRKLNGYNPFNGVQTICDTISNIEINEITTTIMHSSGNGFLSGCNADSVSAYAEAFEVKESKLTGLQVYIGSIDSGFSGGIHFAIAVNENGSPGKEIMKVYVPYEKLHLYFNYIPFYPYVTLQGKFFVTYMPDCLPGNPLAIELVQRRKGPNTAYARVADTWYPMSDFSSDGLATSLFIQPIVCTTVVHADAENNPMLLYPNPVSSTLIVTLPDHEGEIVGVQVSSVEGCIQSAEYSVYFDNVTVDVSSLPGAAYLLKVITRSGVYIGRFVKL